ncbi:hypothetical protein JCGZ_08549 [Jatropha curcas]|uniref:PAR1 protein n=1 Tax=Jatropha curcas TaxID=180498 RepID=A0A067LDT3_JATCU|nr:uncharacterized protein LOC105631491 [Jatropha curcas]KDP46577.1 hypothetical protein JCGZ_08549 [Jatropha curcas]
MALIIFIAFSLVLHGALGELVCEKLPVELCSYSIASSSKRCLIENFATKDGKIAYQCKTSEVVVDILHEWIESDECISACGVDRNTVGISSDTLLQPQFLAKLCSNDCYQSCPNIVDLYFNLALGEGVFLPDLCTNPRRALSATGSSSYVAPGPAFFEVSPAAAPVPVDVVDPACAPTTAI